MKTYVKRREDNIVTDKKEVLRKRWKRISVKEISDSKNNLIVKIVREVKKSRQRVKL